MANVDDLARGHEQLRALIEFTLAEGWRVTRARNGQLCFVKPGYASICTGSAASGHCASPSAHMRPCRVHRETRGTAGDVYG